jgi:late competence protein required for DNA uptake (superfamily II DNA/RNA helicase)
MSQILFSLEQVRAQVQRLRCFFCRNPRRQIAQQYTATVGACRFCLAYLDTNPRETEPIYGRDEVRR